MGAWGNLAFENDDAWDWLAKLENAEDASILVNTFNAVLESDSDYIDIREASNAIAAAEIVAALLGRAILLPETLLPETAIRWVEKQTGTHSAIDSAIVKKARNAVNQVLENSELREVWEDSGSYSAWKASVDDLLGRLEPGVE